MPDTWTIINTRMEALDKFYQQVDKTRKRLKLEKFTLTDFDGKTELKDVISITENRSATYAMRIIAALMSNKWQTTIEGDISKKNAFKIEEFIDKNLEQADQYMLEKYGLAGLDAWLCNHVCHTSLIGVEWLSYFEDGEYKVHCYPMDMRWTPFVLNKWYARIIFKGKDELEQELEGYEKTAKDNKWEYTKPTGLKDTDNELRSFWDDTKNELWLDGKKIFEQPNPYKETPSVIVWPPSGFMFRDKGYLEYESPGLLYLNEQLYDQLSRQLSVDATLGFETVLPSYERETEDPGDVSMPVPKRGESQDVAPGGRHQLVPRGDINQAQVASRNELTTIMSDAAPMAPRAYTQPPSAVEVATEVELLDELQNPRIIALQMFKEQLARKIIDQCITLSEGSYTIGKRGRKKTFSVADLKDPDTYDISYVMLKQNKRLAIVNESRALALWGKAPMHYILRDVLSVDDPDGWMRQMELEEARRAMPELALFEGAIRYAEEAEEMEDEADRDAKNWQSMMLLSRYVKLMKGGQPTDEGLREAVTPTGNTNAMAMLGQGGALPKMPRVEGAQPTQEVQGR